MVDINLLDKLMAYLGENKGIEITETPNPHFTEEENEHLEWVAVQLQLDGYAESVLSKNLYYLTVKGYLALEETLLGKYKNRPYKRMRVMKGLRQAWLIAKIVAVSLNALLILALAAYVFLEG